MKTISYECLLLLYVHIFFVKYDLHYNIIAFDEMNGKKSIKFALIIIIMKSSKNVIIPSRM